MTPNLASVPSERTERDRPVADEFSNEINVGPPPLPLRKRRSYGWLLWLVVLLVVIGGGGAYAWFNYDHLAELTHSAAASATGATSATDKTVNADDFDAFQQKTSTSLQAATDLVASQQAELKRLSDQVEGLTGQVAALTSKLDQQQASGAPAPAGAGSPATAPARASVVAATPVRPVPAAPRKRPTAPKPAGAISVGGAPLPPQPAPR